MIQFNKKSSFTVLVCCNLTWLPVTKQASLNQDAIKSIRRARSTSDDNSTDKWWCVERNVTKSASGSFEIQQQLIDIFNISITRPSEYINAQVSHKLYS